MDLDSRFHRLVLATSDTQSCVRSHSATDSVPHTGSSSGSGSIGLYHASSSSSSSSSSGGGGRGGGGSGGVTGVAGWDGVGGGDGEEGVGIGPVTLCAESYFTAPVAACSFREVLTPVKILRLFSKPEEAMTDLFSPKMGTNMVRILYTIFGFLNTVYFNLSYSSAFMAHEPYLILSYLILFYLILYYLILSYLILSYIILYYIILSYLVLSYLILSYLILSYLYIILFYLIFSYFNLH